jgi:NB-ARC domain
VDPIVVAFGTALVGAMATDVWQQACAGVVALWRRVHPQQADTVEADLEGLRGQVLDARQAGRADTEQALTGVWQGRLQQLLLDDPGLAAELRRVLDNTLTPALTPAEQARVGTLIMTGSSHGSSTFNQVAGNQYNVHPPPAPPLSATCTLPTDTAAFTGRTKELHDIIPAVTAAAEAGRVVAIHAIGGMPGVGKTALAVHVGHLLADRFPDRQLFLDLHAHTAGQEPVKPEAALASLLAADGVDARYLPDGLDERATLWRDRMAHKRVLLVFDNAASSAQVAPLLPGVAGCLVLITSRRYLGDLPWAVPVPLDILAPEEAQEMFLRLAPRAAAEPARVAELIALCGYLPLAISLLANVFSTRRSWTLGQLIDETKMTLLTVTAENRTVAAAFDLSYQYLPVLAR